MRYFANPSTPKVRDAMAAGLLGCIDTPKQGNRVPVGVEWCADNGCGPGKGGQPGKGWPGYDAWWKWLSEHDGLDRCAFAVAPDVVGDAAATLERSLPWLPQIRALGVPAAFVAQNGIEDTEIPWDLFDVLFIGGDDDFKLGAIARALTTEAKARGKRVHMGRVNSAKRFRYARLTGCDSADGTYIAHGPDVNLPIALGWIVEARDQGALL